MITWAVIVSVGGALGILGWRFYVRPYLMPMEGVEKLAFVVWSGVTGGGLLGLAPSVAYRLPCALIGLVLLACSLWSSWGAWRRWRIDRIMFRPSSAVAPAPRPAILEERAA